MRSIVIRSLALASALLLFVSSAPSEAKGTAVVTYSGLKFGSDGGASLRVELSSAANVVPKEKGKRTRFLIDGATVERRNNLNPLDASFFCSNLLWAKLDRKKEGVFVTIELRNAVPVTARTTSVGGGAIVEFSVPGPTTGSASGCK